MNYRTTYLLCFLVVFTYVLNAQDNLTAAITKVEADKIDKMDPETPTPPEEEEESPFSISGFVDAYYAYSFNDAAFPTSFTESLNSFNLGMANVVFSKEGKVGFVADIAFGPRAETANGYVNDDGSISSLSLIKQLYVTYSPLEALTFTAGNFGTHVGYEIIDSPGNINYSTSYMFSNGPFYHTGIKADVSLSESVGLMVGLFNDTDSKIDEVAGKHLGAQLSFESGDFAGYLNFLSGQEVEETEFTSKMTSSQIDLTATYQATEALGLGVNATSKSFNTDGGDDASWSGAALYANYAFSDGFTLGLRGEYIGDKDGLITGVTDNSLFAFTASGNFHVGALTIIPEIRFDSGKEEATFTALDGEALKTTSGFIMAIIYAF